MDNNQFDYQNIFKIQWKNYCNEFVLNARQRNRDGLSVDKLNEWIKLTVQRFANIGQNEGAALRELKDTEFAENFLTQLLKFRFIDVSINNKRSQLDERKPLKCGALLLFIAIAVPIYASLHIELPFPLIEVPMWKPILFGVSLGIFTIVKTYRDIVQIKDKIDEQRRTEFARQMVDFGEKMAAFCKELRK